MSSPVFALSRTDYYHERSYADYLRLVQLSGYETCYFDEMDIYDPARCYILSPYDPNWGGFPDARARLIWYDLEWRMEQPFPDVPGISEVWVADAWYAKHTGKKYVPLGSHAGLAQGYDNPPLDKLYDVMLLAYLTNRRVRLIMGGMWEGLKIDGFKELGMSIAPQGWGPERHNALKQTRLMVHIHQQDNVATIAPQRVALAAAYSLPVLCEQVEEWGIFGYSHLLRADYEHLPRQAKMWTENGHQQLVADFGRALHQLLCVEQTFKKNVEAAL